MSPGGVDSRSLEPFRHSAFRNLFCGRLASFIGNALAPIAIAFAILDLTGSAAALGLVIACRTLPQVLLILFGGVIADRFSRIRVLVVSSALGAVTQAMAAALLLSGNAQVWQIAVIEALNGAVSAFAFPAALAITPQTVPSASLQQANVLLRLAGNFALITGAAAGGIAVATVGSGWAVGVDAVTFAVAAVYFSRIRLRSDLSDDQEPAHARTSMFHELREGWREFASRSWLWSVVVAFGFINAAEAGSVAVLGPVVANDSIGPAGWGLVLACIAAGMVVGGLISLRVRPQRTLLVGMLGIGLMVPFLVVLAVHPTMPILIPAALLSGVGVETFGIYWDLSMQQHVPQAVLSRVYSYDALGSYVLMPIGLVAAGPLAILIGTEAALLAAAGLITVAMVATIAVPSVRRLRRTDVA